MFVISKTLNVKKLKEHICSELVQLWQYEQALLWHFMAIMDGMIIVTEKNHHIAQLTHTRILKLQ